MVHATVLIGDLLNVALGYKDRGVLPFLTFYELFLTGKETHPITNAVNDWIQLFKNELKGFEQNPVDGKAFRKAREKKIACAKIEFSYSLAKEQKNARLKTLHDFRKSSVLTIPIVVPRPQLVLSTDPPRDWRNIAYDVAHELGHLFLHPGCLHGNNVESSPPSESDINAFAKILVETRHNWLTEYPIRSLENISSLSNFSEDDREKWKKGREEIKKNMVVFLRDKLETLEKKFN